ncbi:MAG: putative membrane protein [Limisphaerales bacterium]|jgi:putative membrane protein
MTESLSKTSERKLNRLIIGISVAVTGLVGILFFTPALNLQIDVSFLPKLNAMLNSGVSIMLMLGIFFVKTGRVGAHRISMMGAFSLSAVFLISYVLYHSASESTHYGGEGIIRTLYFIILLSHILLAILIFPLILLTISKAITGRLEQHRKLAKWTFPLWLYVSVTGVIVYLMISPYYV